MRMIRYSCCIISSGARLILWVLCYPWKPIRMSIPPSLSLYPSLFIRVCGLHKILFGSIPFHFALWNRHTFIIVAITFHLKWANATKWSASQRENWREREKWFEILHLTHSLFIYLLLLLSLLSATHHHQHQHQHSKKWKHLEMSSQKSHHAKVSMDGFTSFIALDIFICLAISIFLPNCKTHDWCVLLWKFICKWIFQRTHLLLWSKLN